MRRLLIFIVCIMILFVTGCQKKEVVTDIEDVSGNLNVESGNVNTESSENNEISNDYFFPNSSAEKIQESELAKLSVEELDIAKNEIFARHGHDFSTKTLREYFESKKWYKAIENKKVAVSELNEIEQANVALIDKVIREEKDKNQYVNLNRTKADNLPDISKVNLDGVDIIINNKRNDRMLTISNSVNSNIVEKEFDWSWSDVELSIFQDKYLIVIVIGVPGISDDYSELIIYDNGLNEKMETDIYYGMYRIVDNKIILTDYEFETYEEFLKDNDEKDWINMTPLYRVDYEIVKEGDTFKLNKISEDRKDVKWSCAVP